MTGLQKLVDAAVAAALKKFATLNLRADELAVTLVDLRDSENADPIFPLASPEGEEGRGEEVQIFPDQNPSPQPSPRLGGEREPEAMSSCAHHRGDAPIYPASVVKLFYLVAAHRQMEDGTHFRHAGTAPRVA